VIEIRAIPSEVRTEIESRLQQIEHQEGVRFLVAVESGSRAWGFPSPDSDYDVRFIYVRPRNWYLSIKPGRDVIETPLIDLIDLNGWDIRKALGLMLKSNVIVSEWLESPIRYRIDDPGVSGFRELADSLFDPIGARHHYVSLGTIAAQRWLRGSDAVPVKRYFYSLRPALALRAIRTSPDRRPPMNLQQLIDASELPVGLEAMIVELVALKALTNEKSNGKRFAELDTFILSELEQGLPDKTSRRKQADFDLSDRFFRELLST
jgi:predicted nucleotidyltransferase